MSENRIFLLRLTAASMYAGKKKHISKVGERVCESQMGVIIEMYNIYPYLKWLKG